METLDFFLKEVLIPLSVGILGSFLYPLIRSYLKNLSLSSHQREIKTLLVEYSRVIGNKKNVEDLGLTILREITGVLATVSLQITLIGVLILLNWTNETKLIGGGVIAFLGGRTVQGFSNITNMIKNVTHFDEYRKKTVAKMKKLGLKPESLDDIDNLPPALLEAFIDSLVGKK